MKVIIDTREQLELEFNHPYITSIIRRKLDVGDYAVEFEDGFSPAVRFERKSVSDLFGTMSKGYSRFKKEIIRAQEAGIILFIVIEGEYSKVGKGYKHSRRKGQSVLDQLWTLLWTHHIPFMCFKNRKEMARAITDSFISLGKKHEREKKLTNKENKK
jgi:ERCC4-type nuclease